MTTPDAEDRPSDRGLTDAEPAPPAAGRIALFLLCFVLMLAGFWLMGRGVDLGNGVLFSGGIAATGIAFALGLHRPGV